MHMAIAIALMRSTAAQHGPLSAQNGEPAAVFKQLLRSEDKDAAAASNQKEADDHPGNKILQARLELLAKPTDF